MVSEYKVYLRPHPITWTQRDDLLALWEAGVTIVLCARSAEVAKRCAQAALPWRLMRAMSPEVLP